MPSDVLKDAVTAHFETLFAADVAAGATILRVLRNAEDPTPPRAEADLAKLFVMIAFPPTKEDCDAIGAPGLVPWDESGVFMVHVAMAKYAGDDEAIGAAAKRVRDALRNQVIGDVVDVLSFFESDAGDRWRGNWTGESFAVEFFRPGGA